MANITGTSANNTLTGTAAADTITGLGGNDTLSGGGGIDRVDGGTGNDTLNGGAGVDLLIGGAGNDTYTIDNAGEINKNTADAGIDTVRSSVNYTLGAQQEHLTLIGNAALNGTGNSSVNTLTGNGGANTLSGLNGNDTLAGAGGNDNLIGGAGNDTADGGTGNDTLNGGAGNDRLLGGAGNDTLLFDALDTRGVNGGADTDTLKVTVAGTVDLVSLNAMPRFTNLEIINLGSGNQTLVLNESTVIGLSGSTNALRIVGGSGDAVTTQGNWTTLADITIGAAIYHQFQSGAAVMRVHGAVSTAGIEQSPLITSSGGAAEASIVLIENEDSVTTVVATDGNDDTLIYSIASGADAALISIDAGSGVLTFITAPDFEVPADAGADNGYEVVVLASDGTLTDSQSLTITITNAVDEPVVSVDGAVPYVIGSSAVVLDGAVTITDPTDTTLAGATVTIGDVQTGDVLNFSDTANIAGLYNAATGVLTLTGTDTLANYELALESVTFGTTSLAQADRGVRFTVNDGVSHSAADTATVDIAPEVSLTVLDGSNGFLLNGAGSSSDAGDVNGDGFADLIVGDKYADVGGTNSGAAYVVFGSAAGFGSAFDLSGLNGSDGFRLDGDGNNAYAGKSVSGAGDVNGDGFGDVIVTSVFSGGFTSATHVVFGTDNGFDPSLDLSALNGGNGFRLSGESGSESGVTAAAAGDVNGDGYGDVVIGISTSDANAPASGAAYVVFGAASFGASLDLASLSGGNGFQVNSPASLFELGSGVFAAGDVNGDGFGDVILGAAGADLAGANDGAAYVIFGKSSWGATFNLTGLTGANGFRINGATPLDNAGRGTPGAGDFNGDGFTDLLVDARFADVGATNTGSSFVVFGAASGWSGDLALSALNGTNGFQLTGEAMNDQSGHSVAFAGDLDGDGYDDVLVGTNGSSAYVVFGGATGPSATLNLSALNGGNGFQLIGAGTVAAAGDVNGDGFADLSVGGYVIFGRDFRGEISAADEGGAADESLTGTAAAESLIGGAGNDTLDGGAGADVLNGGAGNDVLTFDTSDAHLDGGSGTDTAALSGSGVTLDLTDVPNNILHNIEIINLTGSGNNTLTLDALALVNLSDASNTLRVDGNSGDVVNAGAGWVHSETVDIGGQFYEAYTRWTGAGSLYVDADVTVTLTPVSALSLADLNGSNGFQVSGEAVGDFSGISVSNAEDVNGDGFADLLVGAISADPNGTNYGASYVVFGAAGGFGSNLNLSDLNGSNGFQLSGEAANDVSGNSVSAAGDVNGDGFADLLVGAYGADPNGNSLSGASYVVFGAAGGFGSNLNLSDLNGSNGFQLSGEAASDYSGGSVSAAGDVNGDGFADLLVGAYRADPNGLNYSGASYVVFGAAGGFASNLDLSDLNGSNGFQLSGEAANDLSGRSVSAAGDVNGDGFDDLLVGANRADPNSTDSGASYVVFGAAGGFASNLNLSDLNGSNGFQLSGEADGDFSGRSVSAAGDVNGDGFDDLLVGAYRASPNGLISGASYVVFGAAGGFASNLNLSDLNGSNGFQVSGKAADDRSGISVSNAGDVNGDGFDDLLVGASTADANGPDSGAIYVVFGAAGGFASNFNLAALNGSNGFQLSGEAANDSSGISVSAAGDVNGDGFDDLLVGARYADPNGLISSGATYVIFGGDFRDEADFIGGAGNDTHTGTGTAEILIGGLGNDTLIGGGGADAINGGAGNDVLTIDAGDFHVNGGSGVDTVIISGSGITLDLTDVPANILHNVEVIDLTGSGNNTLILNELSLLNLSDTINTLRVDGNSGDVVNAGIGWLHNESVEIGGQSYEAYKQLVGVGTLYVDSDVTVTLTPVSVLELSFLYGSNGFQLSGEAASDFSGRSVSAAGDVNGDGFDDLMVGANGNFSGASYVVFGAADGFSSNLNLSALNGSNGFQLSGESVSSSSVSGAGDVNGDGFDDLLIGFERANSNDIDSGASYVVFGAAAGHSSNLNLSALNGNNGFQLSGESEYDRSGSSVSGAGDVNGDGFDDLLIGARRDPFSSYTGAGYVVFGAAGGFTSTLELSALNGNNGFQLSGAAAYDRGASVSAAGDMNGDGFDDLIVGAVYADPNVIGSGGSYVVFGAAGGYSSNLDLSDLNGNNGFQMSGGDYAGFSVSSAGDVNGDGLGDVIVGAYFADPNGPYSGASYVVFGSADGFASNLNLSDLDGYNGFQLSGEAAGDVAGVSVSAAGDVNGDGYADLIVGASGSDSNGSLSGASYVVFGASGGFNPNLDLSDLNGTNGFQLSGEAANDFSGSSVSAAGDVNGDGFDDLLVGAARADPNGSSSGASYVIFGGDFRDDADFIGGAGSDTHTGTGAAEILIGGLGNDTLNGGGGADVFNGGEGDDVLNGSSGADRMDGGTGNDRLNGGAGSDRLEGQDGADRLDGGTGNDALTGGGDNDIFLFNDALGGTNVDTIMDFGGAGGTALDRIRLDNAVFTALADGALSASAFETGTDNVANAAATRIIYNTTTGALFYDTDGSAGGSSAVQFAVIASDVDGLSAADFVVI